MVNGSPIWTSAITPTNLMPFAVHISLSYSGWATDVVFGPIDEGAVFNVPLMQSCATWMKFRPSALPRRGWDWRRSPARPGSAFGSALAAAREPASEFAEVAQAAFDVGTAAAVARVEVVEPAADLLDKPLGAARARRRA